MALFRLGDHLLTSGKRSYWKIDCDGLGAADWQALAAMAFQVLPSFRAAVGVPRGGLPFAAALRPYAIASDENAPVIVCEDVWTTGGSMLAWAAEHVEPKPWIGVVAFARAPVTDSRVRALWSLHPGVCPP